MNFSIRTCISLAFCGMILHSDLVNCRFNLNGDRVVGVSQYKLGDYLTKAIEGFQKVILNGDEDLNYPIMDPLKLEDVSWDLLDESPSKKYSLNFFNTKPGVLEGLSNYRIFGVETDAKDMRLSFTILFNNLRAKIPYKLDGYLYKNILPIYGEGLLELATKYQDLGCSTHLNIDQDFIVVENVHCFRYLNDIDIKISGLMDLPQPFASIVLDDFLDPLVKQHGSKTLAKHLRNMVEEAIGGMTVDEFFDYLDHFVKKYDQQ